MPKLHPAERVAAAILSALMTTFAALDIQAGSWDWAVLELVTAVVLAGMTIGLVR